MNYHKIEKFSTNNGTGIRVVFWSAGCTHHCKGCHNPQTWDIHSGSKVTKNTYKELALALEPSYITGITWSGGDPLHPNNREDMLDLVTFVHDNFQKTQWLYTGYLWEDIKHLEIIKYIDVIVEGPFIEELKDITLAFRGSSNQRIIDVQASLKGNKIILLNDLD